MRYRSLALLALVLVVPLAALDLAAQSGPVTHDLVLAGGRVIDPANQLDGVRSVAISNGRIAAISTSPLLGKQTIDVGNLVVAPGFIDLNAHGQTIPSQTYQVRDGVTTALELEIGAFPLTALRAREGRSLINYGYSAGHTAARLIVKQGNRQAAYHEPLTNDELKEMLGYLRMALDQGALGIGVGLDYVSRGVKPDELDALFRLAAKRKVPLFIHIRMPDDRSDVSGLKELLDLAETTGAAFHMVHIVSTGLGRVPTFLGMIDQARGKGLDVTTEVYPYTAGATWLSSSMFDHDWQKKIGIGYGAIEWPPTGERFTGKAMWDEYRARYPDGFIFIHAFKEEWVEQALRHPVVMIASDSLPIASLGQRSHPRSMGTFARVLGHYARDRKVLTLPEAIRRMTWMPAQRLEKMSPAMGNKGRLSVGADADITVFDAERVIDRATFAGGNQFSQGIVHVLVGGTLVVRDEELVKGVYAGKPVRGGVKPGT
jgi:dihydroorotase